KEVTAEKVPEIKPALFVMHIRMTKLFQKSSFLCRFCEKITSAFPLVERPGYAVPSFGTGRGYLCSVERR
ncbi:MAG: hypothetical protein J6T33_01980, partial [Bacteroidales bacterium]|nr:hypothetical protein [Bacteroidales bacterium]